MEFRTLGPVELWSAGRRHDLGSARARSLLVMLLLTPGAMIPAETLIDRLWDARPPSKARESLTVYVARLRASLRQAVGDEARLVERTQGGYLLEVDPGTADIHRFRRLRRQAAALAASGDHEHAAGLLREADGLWRGQPLAGIRGEWVARMRAALEEERRAALTERIGCELELGQHASLVGELHQLLAGYPLDETLVAHQMTALSRNGRQADALRLYRETRRRLVAELGAEPGAMIADLHQRILAADVRLAPRPAAVSGTPAAMPDRPLPETAAFAGREQSPELVAVFDLSYRALDPAQQRLFRRLGASPCAAHSLGSAAALAGCPLPEAEQALGVLLESHLITQGPDGQFRLHDLIRDYAAARARRDDRGSEPAEAVSRLLGYYLYAAGQADRVLHPLRRRPRARVPQPPGCPVLETHEDAATWLDSEWRSILQAASYAGRHDWKQECADLSHLLAEFLEIRASWAEAITAHRLALQASRYLADPARTARALIALSVVTQHTGRPEAAVPLAEEAAAIYRSLADRGGEAQSLDQVGLAHQRTARSREALAYFAEARILYEAATDRRGVADTLSHAGIASWHLGRHPEAHAHLRAALALYRAVGDRRGEAKALNNLGRVFLHNGDLADALDAYQQSLQIFREIGGPQNEAILCQAIGSVHRYRGSYEEALVSYRRALALYREMGDLPDEADALNDIGASYQSASRYDEALIHHQRARQIADEIGDTAQQLIAVRMIADLHRVTGRCSEALAGYQAALKLAREIGDPYEEGKILQGMAEVTLYPATRLRADHVPAGAGHLRAPRRAGGGVGAAADSGHGPRARTLSCSRYKPGHLTSTILRSRELAL